MTPKILEFAQEITVNYPTLMGGACESKPG